MDDDLLLSALIDDTTSSTVLSLLQERLARGRRILTVLLADLQLSLGTSD